MSEIKKEMVTYTDAKDHIDPEDKQYLICYIDIYGDVTDWDIKDGRSEAYEYCKEVASINQIDLDSSFVLVENLPFTKRKSMRSFMDYCSSIFGDDIDLRDYDGEENHDAFEETEISNMINENDFNVTSAMLNNELEIESED